MLSLAEPPVPIATTTTTPAPATAAIADNSTNADNSTTAGSTGSTGPTGRKKRSLMPSDGTYTSETVAPVNITGYKKINMFEVSDLTGHRRGCLMDFKLSLDGISQSSADLP